MREQDLTAILMGTRGKNRRENLAEATGARTGAISKTRGLAVRVLGRKRYFRSGRKIGERLDARGLSGKREGLEKETRFCSKEHTSPVVGKEQKISIVVGPEKKKLAEAGLKIAKRGCGGGDEKRMLTTTDRAGGSLIKKGRLNSRGKEETGESDCQALKQQ